VLLALSNLDRPERERAIEEAAETADPENLVGLIAVEDAARRNAAIEALTKGGQRSVPALIRALRHPDPEVVMFAANTLGKTRDRSAIPHLVRVLRHRDINVCQAAIESLGLLHAEAALSALDQLLDGDPWLRFAIVHTLGEIGHPSSLRTLSALLEDPMLSESAVGALGKIGGVEAIGELARLLDEGIPSPVPFPARLKALGAALAQLADPAALHALEPWVALAGRVEPGLAARLTEALRPHSGADDASDDELVLKEAAIQLVRRLRLESCYPHLIAAAADDRLTDALLVATADLGAAVIPNLSSAVAHRNPQVRLFACRALSALPIEVDADIVLPLLADPEDEIRAAALRALGRLHHADAIPAMLGGLTDASPGVQGAAVDALARMDGQKVTMALLLHPPVTTRQRELALAIMRENPHPAQIGFLQACLGDAEPDVRCAAVAALSAQHAAHLVAMVEPLLADRSTDVRREVITALGSRRNERARELLLVMIARDAELRGDAIAALGRIGDDRAVPKLIEVFPRCGAAEQVQVIDALGALEATGAEPFLSQQLGNRDADVRRRAAAALARMGTTASLQHLGIALRDEDTRVRLALAQALASCPHPFARATLERLSLDAAPAVAAAARGHLGR
jgi:HEAT repeat protein